VKWNVVLSAFAAFAEAGLDDDATVVSTGRPSSAVHLLSVLLIAGFSLLWCLAYPTFTLGSCNTAAAAAAAAAAAGTLC
jgi:hypothetical protein